MKKQSLMAVALFVLGCATGGATSRVVTPARAQPSASHERYHYVCFKEANTQNVQSQANQLGKDGWELVASALSGTSSFADPIWCFKR